MKKSNSDKKKRFSFRGNSALIPKKEGSSTLSKSKSREDTGKRRYRMQKLTQNEVENLFALPTDDESFLEETKVVTNRYYLTLSNRFRVAAWATVLALAVFFVGMFYTFRDEITVENFRFLMRNVNFRLESSIPSDNGGVGLLYDRDADRIFALYRDYVATVGNGRLTISDRNGNESYYEKLDYGDPVLVTSASDLLCFDRGGKNFSLYSYFNNVYEGSSDYPITDAIICDNGNYAIATREENFYGCVLVYNKDTKLIQKIRKDKYIVSIDLSKDGSSILITSFYTSERGVPITEIAAHPTASTEASFVLTLEGILPYRASLLSDGCTAFFGSDGVKFIDSQGKIYNTSTFRGENVIKYEIGDSFVSWVTADSSNNDLLELTLLASDGKRASSQTEGSAELLAVSEKCCYLYNGSSLCRLSLDGKMTEFPTDPPQAILTAADPDEVYLCLPTRMTPLDDAPKAEQ